jgi:hypothetical protein
LFWYNCYVAKSVFVKNKVYLIEGQEVEVGPLRIKFLRKFMDKFSLMKFAQSNEEAIEILSECAAVCMEQFYPSIKSVEDLEDAVDLPTIYKILEFCAGIKIDPEDKESEIEDQAKKQSESNEDSWEELDLPSLEAQVFSFGAWKNFEELEESITMSELSQLLETKAEIDYRDKKFAAALKGVDLDKQKKDDEWEKMKARVFSGGRTENPDDILTFRGHKAQQAGFGLGMGLDYVDLKKKSE